MTKKDSSSDFPANPWTATRGFDKMVTIALCKITNKPIIKHKSIYLPHLDQLWKREPTLVYDSMSLISLTSEDVMSKTYAWGSKICIGRINYIKLSEFADKIMRYQSSSSDILYHHNLGSYVTQ